jgi:hypothetical protein
VTRDKPPTSPNRAKDNRPLIEIVTIGASAKVSAIDPVSGIEVSVICPAHASRTVCEAAVMAKLKMALARKNGETR